MSERQIKEYYERIEKLLNGANKETYGFVPQEIKNILRSYEELQQENKQLQEELKFTIGIVEHNRIISEKNKETHQLKDNWIKLKEIAKSQSGFNKRADLKGGLWFEIDDLLDKMQELEQGSDSNE